MKKSDLKTGMVVETRDGWRGVVLRDAVCPMYNPNGDKDFLMGLKNPSYDYCILSEYNDNLLLKEQYRYAVGDKFDIMRVYEPNHIVDAFKMHDYKDLTEVAKCIYNRYTEE